MVQKGSVRFAAKEGETETVYKLLCHCLGCFPRVRSDGHTFEVTSKSQKGPIGYNHCKVSGNVTVSALKGPDVLARFKGLHLHLC
ncbi:hypothetical protein ES703_103433 [subsurface metagenome]